MTPVNAMPTGLEMTVERMFTQDCVMTFVMVNALDHRQLTVFSAYHILFVITMELVYAKITGQEMTVLYDYTWENVLQSVTRFMAV
jgi:hypothetical protein